MSLSSALFSGISGLSTLGNAMTVIGDNIANVNTVGFKSSRVTFQDVLSQTVATTAGSAQVGRGTSMADITSSFSQGSFESTDSTTDLAIGGEGFFVVRDANDEENQFYTRAGEFRFDKDGNFTNPAGYIVRGWELDETTGEDKGSITDIILQSFTSSPKSTTKLTLINNLDSDAISQILSLSNIWDGTATTNIATTNYEYQSTTKAYDSLGSTHDITIYYDKISGTDWDYIITCNPSEDNRIGFADTKSLGLLSRGKIAFNESSGAITNLTMQGLTGTTGGHKQSAGDFDIDSNILKGVSSTLTSTDVSVAYNNQNALIEDGTVTMEFDQVPDATYTGTGTFVAATGLMVNNDAALTVETPSGGGTPLTVTKTAITENGAISRSGGTIALTVNQGAELTTDATSFTVTQIGAVENWGIANGGTLTSVTVNPGDESDLTDSGTCTFTYSLGDLAWFVTSVPAAYTDSNGDNIGGDVTGFDFDLTAGDSAEIAVVTADAVGDGTVVTFDINPDNWRVSNVPGAYGLSDGTDIGGSLTGFTIDLSGGSTADITAATTGAIVQGDTVTFDIDSGNWTVSQVPLAYSLDSADDVGGSATGFTLDLNGDSSADITVTTVGAIEGDKLEFDIKPLNWTCTAVPAAYTGLDADDEITGTRTGYALDFGDPSGDDLTVTLAENAVEGDKVSFDITSSTNWTAQTADSSGYFLFQPNFLGAAVDPGTGESPTKMSIQFDIGTHWDGTSFVPHSLASTQFARASTTTFQSADGYGAGDLQSITVGTDGAITGQYSNGQVLPLYRVALAKFQNYQALFKVGGNLFRETRLSGDPTTSRPGTNGLGSISPNSLEQSNTDIATEFVKMITTQRGFQANSKIITVTDQMLAELINMKR